MEWVPVLENIQKNEKQGLKDISLVEKLEALGGDNVGEGDRLETQYEAFKSLYEQTFPLKTGAPVNPIQKH